MKVFRSKIAPEDGRLVAIGDAAPEFELVDHNGEKHKLSSFRGKKVIVSFYRFAA